MADSFDTDSAVRSARSYSIGVLTILSQVEEILSEMRAGGGVGDAEDLLNQARSHNAQCGRLLVEIQNAILTGEATTPTPDSLEEEV